MNSQQIRAWGDEDPVEGSGNAQEDPEGVTNYLSPHFLPTSDLTVSAIPTPLLLL